MRQPNDIAWDGEAAQCLNCETWQNAASEWEEAAKAFQEAATKWQEVAEQNRQTAETWQSRVAE